MMVLFKLLCSAFFGRFRSRASLEAENLALRHQLNVLRRQSPRRLAFNALDRLIFAGLYQFAPSIINALRALLSTRHFIERGDRKAASAILTGRRAAA